jgi:hypothetical protein
MEKITNTGYLYSMNIDNTLKISFNTKKEIKIEDIMT